MKSTREYRWGIVSAAIGITCTTFGHYADIWAIGYVIGVFMAAFGAIAISGETE